MRGVSCAAGRFVLAIVLVLSAMPGVALADGRPYLIAAMSKGYYQAAKLQSLVKAIDAYHASMA